MICASAMGATTRISGSPGEYQRAFRHRPDVSREVEIRQIFEEFGPDMAKNRMPPQIVDLIPRKIHILEVFERLLQPGGHQIIAMGRDVPDKKFKRGDGIKAGLHIARRHR